MRLLFLLSLLLIASSTKACGYNLASEDYRVALFNPYIIGNDYQPFFFSSAYLHNYQNAQAGIDRRRNCQDWANELGGKVQWADMLNILYNSSLDDWLIAKENPNDNPWQHEPAWRALRQRPELVEYIIWAKKYEVPNTNTSRKMLQWQEVFSYWRPEPSSPSNDTLAALQTRAEIALQTADPSSFLARRYAYQLLLMARYRDDETAFNQYFDTYFRNQTDALADWAYFHKIHFLDNDPKQQYILAARSFTRCPEKALPIYLLNRGLSKPSDANIPKNYLADAYAFEALKNYGYAQEQLSRLKQYNPQHSLFPLLLTREVNKLENWLLTDKATNQGTLVASTPEPEWNYDDTSWEDYKAIRKKHYQKNLQKDLAYLKQFRQFVDGLQASKDGQGLDKTTLQLLRAQLAMLDQDPRAALTLTKGLEKLAGPKGTQAAIIQYMALLSEANLQQADTKTRMLELLCRIGPELSYTQGPQNTFPALLRLTSQAFEAQRDTTTAFFFHLHALDLPYSDGYASQYYKQIDYLDRNLSPAVFQQILQLIEGEAPKTPFNTYLLSTILPSSSAIRDVAGTVSLRANRLDAAQQYFEAIPNSWYQEAYAFSDHLTNDPLLPRFSKKQNAPSLIPKAEVVRQLIALEKIAQGTGQKAAQACLQLAEAWFNMSNYGPAWMMLSYGKSSSTSESHQAWPAGQHLFSPHSAADYRLIFQAARAKDYWNKALALSQDPELIAQTTLALLDLDYQQEILALQKNYYYNQEKLASRYLHHQDQLRNYAGKYKESAFFQSAIIQCSSLRQAAGQ